MSMSLKRAGTEPPRLRRSLLPRPRLLTLLSELLDYPLTVLRAGAGYGKTTAIAGYVQSLRIPVRWLTLSVEEQDLSSFVTRILTVCADVTDQAERVRVREAAAHPPPGSHRPSV